MFKPAHWMGGLLVALLGCSTASQPARRERPPDWEMPGQPPAAPTLPVVPAAPRPAAPVPAPAPAAAIATVPAPPQEDTWISLNRWSRDHGLGELQRLSVAPVVSYALITPRGVFAISIGSLAAQWDGVEIRLGFTPQLIGDQVFVHSLDVHKNLELLLAEFAAVPLANRVIVLDPGHGGANTGTRSVVDGRFEKEFTLDWAWRLARALQSNGWSVWLTRTNDLDISLADRTAIANLHQAGLFLSLHFNSAESGHEQAGLETYCLTPAGMPSSLTRGYPDELGQSFPNNAYDAQNLQYAVRLHRALLQAGGVADRGVRRARFMGVLRGQERPAILIEGGYLSNPREARLISDPAYRQKLAEAVAAVLTQAQPTAAPTNSTGAEGSVTNTPLR